MIKLLGRKLFDIWGNLGFAPGWRYQAFENFGSYLASPSPIVSYLPNGCQIYCDLRDHVQRQIYFMGSYEPVESYIFTHLIKPGMTVIDAGANIGQYTLLASAIVGSEGAVHSFEPVPTTFKQLDDNIAANNLLNVHLNQAALWKESTTLKLSLANDMKDNIGAYSAGVTNGGRTVEANAISLDEYVLSKAIRKVYFIKMDIEGAEYCAILGMQNLLERDRPILLLEFNRLALQRFRYAPEDLWVLLTTKFGYTGYLVGIDTAKKIDNVSGIEQANILFSIGSLPDTIDNGWDFKQVLSWARSGYAWRGRRRGINYK